jgi:hypothetical protein
VKSLRHLTLLGFLPYAGSNTASNVTICRRIVQLNVTRDCGVGVCFGDEQCEMGRVAEKPVRKNVRVLLEILIATLFFRTSLVKFGQFLEV